MTGLNDCNCRIFQNLGGLGVKVGRAIHQLLLKPLRFAPV